MLHTVLGFPSESAVNGKALHLHDKEVLDGGVPIEEHGVEHLTRSDELPRRHGKSVEAETEALEPVWDSDLREVKMGVFHTG